MCPPSKLSRSTHIINDDPEEPRKGLLRSSSLKHRDHNLESHISQPPHRILYARSTMSQKGSLLGYFPTAKSVHLRPGGFHTPRVSLTKGQFCRGSTK